jgi:hypothetical protein
MSQLSQQPYDRERTICDTKSIQMGLVMRTFNNMQTPSTNNIMSNQRYKEYKGGGERTWAYSH